MDEPIARAFLTEALRRAPDHFGAIQNMTTYISPHWHGSREEALAFGREMSSGAPEGSLRAGTTIASYVSIWHEMHYFDDDANDETIQAYLASPAVHAEIQNAYNHSVGSAQHQLSQWSYGLLNRAAAVFYMLKDKKAAADALARIGDRQADYPWIYLGKPAKIFAQARQWATAP
jgi:hypothetical protein